MNSMLLDYIKKEDLVVGQEYYCIARNFSVGTWDGEAFTYMRAKFTSKYMDTEQHWDDGAPHGTAKPLSRWGVEDDSTK